MACPTWGTMGETMEAMGRDSNPRHKRLIHLPREIRASLIAMCNCPAQALEMHCVATTDYITRSGGSGKVGDPRLAG
jgi:hypothetical protein